MNARRYLRLLEIVDNGHYCADTATGKVLNTRKKPLKADLDARGYEKIKLCKNGKYYNYRVHEVIAFFGGLNLLNMTVNHINGVKTDNRLENLECISNAENLRHARETGLWKAVAGENHCNAKLTADDIRAIRARYAAGNVTQQALAAEYGVNQGNIGRIVRRESYTNVSDVIALTNRKPTNSRL